MTIPGSKRLLFICLRARLLTCPDKVVARYQLYSGGEKTVLLSHGAGTEGGDPEVLGADGPVEERQGLGHRLLSHNRNLPHGTVGAVSQLKSF